MSLHKLGKNVTGIITQNDQVFNAEAIRDTANHDSDVSDNSIFDPRTIFVKNGLNQTVTIQLQGSRNRPFTDFVDIGSSFDVAATTNGYGTISDYFPFIRIRASCATSPTTGTLDIWILKRT
jgi:hypothetical protein